MKVDGRESGGGGLVDVRSEILELVGSGGVALGDALAQWQRAGIPILAVSRGLTALFLSGELVLTDDKCLVLGGPA